MIAELRRFTHERQALGRGASSPQDALRAVAAVYSSHPSGPVSLWARSRRFSAREFFALDALRVPAMRGSIHIVAREAAPLAFGLTRESPATRDKRLAYFGLDRKAYTTLKRRVRAAAKEPRTAAEFKEEIGFEGSIAPVLGGMNREGILIRVAPPGLRSNALRYQAATLERATEGEALGWAAGEYLRAFGPARVEDFRWWVGTSVKAARAALDGHDTIDVGEGFLLRAEDERAFDSAKTVRKSTVDVVPKWDALTMGYPKDGRARFLDPELNDRAYDFRGDGRGLVLAGGEAVAAFEGGKRGIEVDWFEKPGATLKAAAAKRFDEMEAVLA
ncbi:MAG: winged helix DNA-binding domain-containing protein [Thermoleophilaceae bacterium]|nr:winged helix DNA-binding domain-containing protein [Thermoleophilaceae bacterium]